MEHEAALVPLGYSLHLKVRLVAHNVIQEVQTYLRPNIQGITIIGK